MKNTFLKTKMKLAMKTLYNTKVKTIQVSVPPQNLQLQHKMHHNLGHQQTIILLEFQLGLLVQDKIHMILNHTQIHLHGVTLPLTFPLTQMKKNKMKLKI